ncbi:MAG: malate synthase [Firmicutes bacterium]|nr:malate synthase [Bacillota bacterium]
MNLENVQVVHKSFGEGSVVEHNGSYVEVCFPCGNKRFVYPDAFGTFLKVADPQIAQRVDDIREELEKERREKELAEAEIRAEEEERRQLLLERERLIKSHKLSPASQAVFWCDEEEQDRVFTEWTVFTGLRQSGVNQGQPNRLVRLHHNSACLITSREDDVSESERRILGLFMVEPSFVGSLCEDGYIPAHPKFRMRFSDEESRRLLFWNYYVNERYPNNMTWNSGRHRYFDNVWMAQILKDVLELKQGTEEQKLAEELLAYFCNLNLLDSANLSKPNGALARNA